MPTKLHKRSAQLHNNYITKGAHDLKKIIKVTVKNTYIVLLKWFFMAKKPEKRGDKTTNAKTWSCSNSRKHGCVIKEVKAEPRRNDKGRCLNCGTGWINEDPKEVYGWKQIKSFMRDRDSVIISGESFGRIKLNLKFNKRTKKPVMAYNGNLFAWIRDHEDERLIHAWIPQDLQVWDEKDLVA